MKDFVKKHLFHKVISAVFALLFITLAIKATKYTLDGCDFIQLHFKSLNERNIYFNNVGGSSGGGDDIAMIGLGLRSHEPFTDKNSYDWINNSTCLPYDRDDVIVVDEYKEGSHTTNTKHDANEMFYEEMELSQAEGLFTLSFILLHVAVSVIGLNVLFSPIIMSTTTRTSSTTTTKTLPSTSSPSLSSLYNMIYNIILYSAMIIVLISGSIQHYAYHTLDEGKIDICNRDRYFPTKWYETYPLYEYPEYKYMKFFAECKLGDTSMHALNSIIYQYIVGIWLGVVWSSIGLWSLGKWMIRKKNEYEYHRMMKTYLMAKRSMMMKKNKSSYISRAASRYTKENSDLYDEMEDQFHKMETGILVEEDGRTHETASIVDDMIFERDE